MIDALADDRHALMEAFRKWLNSPLVYTRENWGTTPEAAAAAAAMEALSPPAEPREKTG